MSALPDDADRHRVVVNDAGQYSVWPVDRPLPAGWSDEGATGSYDECIRRVGEVWLDQRPRTA